MGVGLGQGGSFVEVMILGTFSLREGMLVVPGDIFEEGEGLSHELLVDEPIVLEILLSDGTFVLEHLNC